MDSRYNNEYWKEINFLEPGEMLFLQKIIELMHLNSGIAYSYKINNAYSILLELRDVIVDYFNGRLNGFLLEDVRKEAKQICDKDDVMSKRNQELFCLIKDSIKAGFLLDKDSTKIKERDEERLRAIHKEIDNWSKCYSAEMYLKDTLELLRDEIVQNNGEKIINLTESLVSSFAILNRSIKSGYLLVNDAFIKFKTKNPQKTFEDCWRKFKSCLIGRKAKSKYICFFKILIEETYIEKMSGYVTKEDIVEELPLIEGDNDTLDGRNYLRVEVEAPSSDFFTVVKKALKRYTEEMGIIEFTTMKINNITDVLVWDEHFNRPMKLNLEEYMLASTYKPYNKYHKDIDKKVRVFISKLTSEEDRNKVMNAIISTFSFAENKEYSFLLLWSSLESLFRSNQYSNAITAIRDSVPNILTHRYIFYRLYDFLKECKNIQVSFIYNDKELIIDTPNEERIMMLFELLRDEVTRGDFLNACKEKYELLYYRGLELQYMLHKDKSIMNNLKEYHENVGFQLQRMYSIRNKFVHHSIVYDSIEAICKHIRVYMWEALREMSYVAVDRNIESLEELYAYFRMDYKLMQKKIDSHSEVSKKNITNGFF